MMKDVGGLGHFHHKCALALEQVIGSPDSGKYAVDGADHGGFSGHVGADLGHQDDQGSLSQIGAFPGHVGTGDDQQAMRGPSEVHVIRNKPAWQTPLLQDRVASVRDDEPVVAGQFGTAIGIFRSDQSQPRDDVNGSEHLRELLDSGRGCRRNSP